MSRKTQKIDNIRQANLLAEQRHLGLNESDEAGMVSRRLDRRIENLERLGFEKIGDAYVYDSTELPMSFIRDADVVEWENTLDDLMPPLPSNSRDRLPVGDRGGFF